MENKYQLQNLTSDPMVNKSKYGEHYWKYSQMNCSVVYFKEKSAHAFSVATDVYTHKTFLCYGKRFEECGVREKGKWTLTDNGRAFL